MEYRKEYVTVKLRVDPDGSIRPLSFIWVDGVQYKIDRLIQRTRAAYTAYTCGFNQGRRARNAIYYKSRWKRNLPV